MGNMRVQAAAGPRAAPSPQFLPWTRIHNPLTMGPQPQACPAMNTHTTAIRPIVTSLGSVPSGNIWVAITAVMTTSAAIIWKEASTIQNLRPSLGRGVRR